MGARGPKSSAALAVVSSVTEHRPAPPKELTPEQAAEWEAIVGRLPHNWFPRETHGLLVALLRHWSTCRFLSKQIDAFNPAWIAEDGGFERYSQWLALRERESRAMAGLAVKLRLTNQSRYTPATAQRQAQSPFGFIDAEGRMKPWQKHV